MPVDRFYLKAAKEYRERINEIPSFFPGKNISDIKKDE